VIYPFVAIGAFSTDATLVRDEMDELIEEFFSDRSTDDTLDAFGPSVTLSNAVE